MMGSERSPDEQPVHPVVFGQPFYLGKTEVTFREWDACVANNACNGYRPSHQGWGRGTRPVINVSWNDAKAYVEWLSQKIGRACRLPSEAEWEYAARAGTTADYALPAPDGSHEIAGLELVNCLDCGSQGNATQTAPVKSFQPNSWRLFDMHGNVWEWVEDCWHGNYHRAPDDGQAWLEDDGGECRRRVLRGGSWYDRLDSARSAFRDWYSPSDRDHDVGFRVVCSSH